MKSHRFSRQQQLIEVEAGEALLATGSKGEGVALLQLTLNLLGFPFPRSIKNGKPDGVFGAETDGVARRFQAEFGLKADGIIGRRSLDRLDRLLVERPCFDSADPAAFGALILARSTGPRVTRLVHHT